MPLLSAVAAATARAFGFTSGGIIPITATGGTVLTPGNGYKYHVFTTPGTFTIVSGNDELLYAVVAGGGAGAMAGPIGPASPEQRQGGGGGGGVVSGTMPASPGPYSITVGAGGTRGPSTWTDGNPSTFGPIVATGGGRGGANASGNPNVPPVNFTNNGNPGGSGGGGGTVSTVPPAVPPALPNQVFGTGGTGNTPPTSPPQGFNGGNAVNQSAPQAILGSGGGGGAGSVGTPFSATPIPGGSWRPTGAIGGRGRSLPEFSAPIISPAIPTATYPVTPAGAGAATRRNAFIYGLTPNNYYAGGGGGRGPNYLPPFGPAGNPIGPPDANNYPPASPAAYLGGANGTGFIRRFQGGAGQGDSNNALTYLEPPTLPPDISATFLSQHGKNALANTGGGGGGTPDTDLQPVPQFPLGRGNGGSGIVMIRYLDS